MASSIQDFLSARENAEELRKILQQQTDNRKQLGDAKNAKCAERMKWMDEQRSVESGWLRALCRSELIEAKSAYLSNCYQMYKAETVKLRPCLTSCEKSYQIRNDKLTSEVV